MSAAFSLHRRALGASALALLLLACDASPAPEAWSLLDEPLHAPPLAAERRRQLEEQLAAAEEACARAADDPDAQLWLGRRLAYLGRFREAIAVFTRGIERWPDDARFYRHRGHRFITLRRFDDAVRDLELAVERIAGRADEIEPDGLPNPQNIPTSTLQGNIWYHLGLAHYLRGEFARAERCFGECLRLSTNDDTLCAATDWLYMTRRRQGRTDEAQALLAPIRADMQLLENFAYHQRLLLYKGERTPEQLLAADAADPVVLATHGYGVGNWHLYNGRTREAHEVFRRVLAETPWTAFGYIAAEVELARPENAAPGPPRRGA